VKHVPNAEAHDLVLKGRFEAQQMTTEALKQAEGDFQRAIDLDPQYAAAYLELGMQKYNEYSARISSGQTGEERRSAERLIQKALELNPDLQAAHGVLAMLAMQYDWDWDRAERELRGAATGASNSGVEEAYAFLLVFKGRFAEADEHVNRIQDLDPFSTPSMNDVMQIRFLEGRISEARSLAEKIRASYPKMLQPKAMISATYIMEGRTGDALQEIGRWEADFPPAEMFRAMAHAQAGHREEALRLMRPYEEKYPNPGVPMQWFALVYGLLGDEPNTVKWLNRSADRHEWQALNLAVQPVFAPMRNSAGFRALKKRMGLAR
jgi:tetratricopeptide (TPR) repeat protein